MEFPISAKVACTKEDGRQASGAELFLQEEVQNGGEDSEKQAEMRPLHVCFTLPSSQDRHVPDPRLGGRISVWKQQSLTLLRLAFCAWEECGRAAGPCSPHQPLLTLSWGEGEHNLPLGVNIVSSTMMDFRGKGSSCLLCVKAGRSVKD